MTAELKGIHAKTFQDLDVIKDVIKLDEEKIAVLEKENAELKIARDNCEEQFQNKVDELVIEVDRVIRAKEIIKTLLSSKTDFDEKRFALWAWKEEVNKAEQFISEVEK